MDYRKTETAKVLLLIKDLTKKSKELEETIDDLLMVSVYHSIKDQQLTPGINLLAAVPRPMRSDVVLYLTKFGTFSYSEKKGLHHSKEKFEAGLNGEAKADEVFEQLAPLYEAFPKAEKEWKDFDFEQAVKAMLRRMNKTQEHGKAVIVKPEHEQIVTLLKNLDNQPAKLAIAA